MNKLSILTPVRANEGTIGYLPETIDSVESQQLPPGWTKEWIVMEDGTTPKLGSFAWPDSVNYRAINLQVGAMSARTLALTAAAGNYALQLDADDTLPEGALEKICGAYDEHPQARWVAGQSTLRGDTTPWVNPNDEDDFIAEGLCPPDELYSYYRRSGKFPVAFQCSYSIPTLWKYGGYPSVPYGEDVSLLFAVSTIEPGVVLHDTILNYRQWPDQMTKNSDYDKLRDLALAFRTNWVYQLRAERDAGTMAAG